MNRSLRGIGVIAGLDRLTGMASRRLRFHHVLSPRKRRNRYRRQKENRVLHDVAAAGTLIHHSLRIPQTSRPIERPGTSTGGRD
jgi:hypothetical protein